MTDELSDPFESMSATETPTGAAAHTGSVPSKPAVRWRPWRASALTALVLVPVAHVALHADSASPESTASGPAASGSASPQLGPNVPAAAAPTLRPGTALRAQSGPDFTDSDRDGIPDLQEVVLQTDPYSFDTDGDGYNDGEEFARQSDPLRDFSTPSSDIPSAALSARGQGGKLRLVLMLHEPEFQIGDAMLRRGVLAGGQVHAIQPERLALLGERMEVAGTSGSRVTYIDVPIDPNFVHSSGTVSFFLATGSFSTQTLGSASKIDVHSDEGQLVLQVTPAPAGGSRQVSQGGGTIRPPLPVAPVPPPTAQWVAGAVGFQRTEVSGVNGARMLHQVVEADCIEGWDSFCSSDCSSSVGDSYETVDPWALLGG